MPKLITVGRLAELLGVPIHRIEYILRSRNIQPCARAGILRLFDLNAKYAVQRTLQSIEDYKNATRNKSS